MINAAMQLPRQLWSWLCGDSRSTITLLTRECQRSHLHLRDEKYWSTRQPRVRMCLMCLMCLPIYPPGHWFFLTIRRGSRNRSIESLMAPDAANADKSKALPVCNILWDYDDAHGLAVQRHETYGRIRSIAISCFVCVLPRHLDRTSWIQDLRLSLYAISRVVCKRSWLMPRDFPPQLSQNMQGDVWVWHWGASQYFAVATPHAPRRWHTPATRNVAVDVLPRTFHTAELNPFSSNSRPMARDDDCAARVCWHGRLERGGQIWRIVYHLLWYRSLIKRNIMEDLTTVDCACWCTECFCGTLFAWIWVPISNYGYCTRYTPQFGACWQVIPGSFTLAHHSTNHSSHLHLLLITYHIWPICWLEGIFDAVVAYVTAWSRQ